MAGLKQIVGRCRRSLPVLFFFLLILSGSLRSQTIRGKVVVSATNQPVEAANAVLQKTADSSLVTGMVTDKNGMFEFSHIPAGEYGIQITLLGYAGARIAPVRVTPADTLIDVGTISLAETTLALEEVTVTSQKELLNLGIDKRVYNVGEDIQSKSISASDVLRNVPSVEVDLDGKVALRGSGDVLIMIDGKTTPSMGSGKTEILQQIPASAVRKIEVMTNPSAKFKPDAEAGIINIVLKKGSGDGFNGGLTVNAVNADRYKGDLRVDYSQDGLSMYGSYSPRQDNRTHIQSQSVAEMSGSTIRNYYEQDDTSTTHNLSHLVLMGGDLRIDESNTAGVSGSYVRRDATTFGMKTTTREGAGGGVTQHSSRIHNGTVGEPDYTVKGYLRHEFDRSQRLQIDIKASKDRSQDVSRFTTATMFPQPLLTYDNSTTTEVGKELELSIDYNLAIDSMSKLETGYSGERNVDDLDLNITYLDTLRQSFVTDPARTNHFIHNEAIHAAYATYERRFGLFGFKAGLRAEQVYGTSDLTTRNTTFDNDYFNLYPTLHLAYKLNESMELQSNYSRRVYRPQAEDLNPFPDYSDPADLFAGNPRLLPIYTHSVEFGCLFQTDRVSFLPMIFYRHKYNRFTNVTTALNDSTLYTTIENLGSDDAAGLEFVLSGSVTSFISTNANADIFYNQIDASALGFAPVKSIVTWRGAMTCDVRLSPTTRVQLNPIYRAARLTPAGEDSPYFILNIGFRQDFMDRRLSLLLSASDVFKSWTEETDWTSGALSENQVRVRDSRIIYFGLTYHLGVPSKKTEKESLKYDDED